MAAGAMQLCSMQMPTACDGLGRWWAKLNAGSGLGRWWANAGTRATKFISATHSYEALAVVEGGVGVGSAELHVLIQLAGLACITHVKGLRKCTAVEPSKPSTVGSAPPEQQGQRGAGSAAFRAVPC